MIEHLISALVIAMGVLATAVGVIASANRLRIAGRAHRRIETLYDSMSESWTAWFLGGFSGVSLGTHWVWAILVLIGWSLAGLGLISLGLRLIWRM